MAPNLLSAATQYLYDDLGRLVLATNSDGSSLVYEHDANGNIVAIHQWASSTVVVAGFSPAYGYAGLPITVLGSGFDPDPGANALTIGGAAATVTAATATALSAVIPSGASTGPISVTVDGTTGVSAQNLVILKPAVTSFTPTLVAPGDYVTITGANLELVPGASISVGGTTVSIASLTNEQAIIVAPNNTGGPITIDTPYGQATSASNLAIVPTSVNVEDVVGHAAIELDGSAETLSIAQQPDTVLYSFEATAGDFLSIQLDSLSIDPSSGWVNFKLYSPSGATIATGAIFLTTAPTVHLPQIISTGQHLMAFDTGSTSSIELSARIEHDQMLTTGGSTLSTLTTVPMQGKRFFFNASAGDDVGLAMTDLGLTPSSPADARIWVYDPNGANLGGAVNCYQSSVPGCPIELMSLPLTGPYTVLVEALGAQTASFGLTLSQAVGGTLTKGQPLNIDLAEPGAYALLSFAGPPGQPLAIDVESDGATPSGESVTLTVNDPVGSQIAQTTFDTDANLGLVGLSSGTYTVLVSPADAAVLSPATVTLTQTFTAWNDSTLPSTPASTNANASELGVKFKVDFDGYVTGIRFYKGTGNTGTHIGNLWSASGQNLGSVTFTNETSTGWQQASFASPVPVTAGTTYVASYYAPAGHFAYTAAGFNTGVDAGPLHLLPRTVSGGNGVYVYSAASAFPTSTYNGSNYWVDVVYDFDDSTPPSIASASPHDGTTTASTLASVKALFDEAIDPTTVNGSTFELRVTGGGLVGATVTYDEATQWAVLTPDAALAPLTPYTATIKGGASGVHDTSGNALGADYTWSFTTASGPAYSVWDDSVVPPNPADPNSGNYELGVKFTADTDGYIAGIRFYKGAGNGGTHVGNLWSASGSLLASAAFANETATGWQQVEFAAPVPVTANTTYVASYHSPQGHFAFSNGYFAASGVDAAPLHLLQNGVSGSNGVYHYGATSAFPTSTYNSSYYWVDVVFVPEQP